MQVLLIGPDLRGGEGAYVNLIRTHPPDGVDYTSPGGFHTSAPGARCNVAWEVALNRFVHPRTIPDMGFRAFRVTGDFDLVHVHAHRVHLGRLGDKPLVMSEGSSSAVYLGDYLGWDDAKIADGYGRARRWYRALRIHDRLLAIERVNRAYVFSEWARQLNIRWGADASKLDVLAPGFPVREPVERAGRTRFSFLFIGTDFERKGGFDVVEAFERLTRERDDVRLVVAGSDPWTPNPDRSIHAWVSEERQARVLATIRELADRGLIEHMPLVPAETLHSEVYPHADAFVMPTLAEGFGFTNVEAMSYGLPVVSSTFGPIPEIVEHGDTGLLVEPGDIDALAEAMGKLAADHSLAQRLGAAGRERFLERYTIEHFRAGLGEVYARASGK